MPRKALLYLGPRSWDFVEDPALKSILRNDYDELRHLVRKGVDKKSIVVMSGTIVEALLAGILKSDEAAALKAWKAKHSDSKDSPPPFKDWRLYDLIQAAVQLKLLDGASEILASALKNFRNLIHPLVQERKLITLNDGTVSTAVALLISVLDHIETARTRRIVGQLEDWVAQRGLVPATTPSGAFMPKLFVDGRAHTPFAIRKNRIVIRFGRLKRGPASPFKVKAKREELRQRLNQIGFNLPSRVLDAFPAIPLEKLAAPGTCEAFIKELDWIVSVINKTEDRTWTAVRFFAKLRKQPQGRKLERIARQLLVWCGTHADVVVWGAGKTNGSFSASSRISPGRIVSVFSVWTAGDVSISLGHLCTIAPFHSEAKRIELVKRLNAVPGLSLPSDWTNKFPSSSMKALEPEANFEGFVSAMQWAFDELRAARDGLPPNQEVVLEKAA